MEKQREKFGSRLGFLLISAGCAIGLGNVYKFPIWCGGYGGGIFLLFYVAFLILLGIPVMCCELAVGRGSQRSIANSFDALEKKGQKWHLMKYLGVAGNYALMMCYCCITGWFVTYLWRYLNGSITNATAGMTLDEAKTRLLMEFVGDGSEATMGVQGILSDLCNYEVFTGIVLLLGFGVCALGLQKGVEKVTKIMMVCLFVLISGLAIYALTMEGTGRALKFYFVPSLENAREAGLTTVISKAMGQAFFTLSLGIGSIAIFGSYIGKDRSLMGEGLTIIGLDTFVALMSGLVLFPAFFTFNPTATKIAAGEAGPAFLFSTLSSIFNQMKAGRVLGTLFFLFMTFAAMSTVIAVLENIMSFWIEWTNLKRWQIALINFLLLAVLVQPFILSYSRGDSFFAKTIFLGNNFGDFEDYFVSNLALPIGSLVYTLFCTWKFGWGWKNFYAEVNTGNGKKLPAWVRPYMTYVLPVIILVVLGMSVL